MGHYYTITPEPLYKVDPMGLTRVLRDLARYARQSLDPSTQNAAALMREEELAFSDPQIDRLSMNYSLDRRVDLTDRELKRAFTVHAEEAVCFGHYPGASCLVALWAACPDCARQIVLAGVREVFMLDMPCPDRWKRSVELGRKVLTDCGVRLHVVRPNFELGETWLHNGAEYKL